MRVIGITGGVGAGKSWFDRSNDRSCDPGRRRFGRAPEKISLCVTFVLIADNKKRLILARNTRCGREKQPKTTIA